MKTITAMGLIAVLVGCTAQAASHKDEVVEEAAAPPIQGRLIFVDLADAGHGIALVGQCAEQPFRCRQRVAVLDGGTQWQLRTSPLADFTNPTAGFSAELVALTPGHAVISSPPDNLVGATRWRQWFTRDAARTWREVSIKATGTTPAIPTGARLIADRLDPNAKDTTDGPDWTTWRILVLDPATGQRKVLAEQPPVREPRVPTGIPAYDGSWWVTGKDPRTGQPAVAVSRDSGVSWTSSPLGSVRHNFWHTSVLAGPSAVYAVVNGELPVKEQVKNGLLAIFRSTDGGRSWQRTWAFRSGHEPRSNLGGILASDGSLRAITETPGSYLSRDGGRTFTRVDAQQGNVRLTGAGYLLTDDETRYLLSTDGIAWQTVKVIQG